MKTAKKPISSKKALTTIFISVYPWWFFRSGFLLLSEIGRKDFGLSFKLTLLVFLGALVALYPWIKFGLLDPEQYRKDAQGKPLVGETVIVSIVIAIQMMAMIASGALLVVATLAQQFDTGYIVTLLIFTATVVFRYYWPALGIIEPQNKDEN